MRADPRFLLPILGLLVAIPLYSVARGGGLTAGRRADADPGAAVLSKAARSKASGIRVEVSGIVESVLPVEPDSLEQRFLVRVTPEVAVNVVHEIRAGLVPLGVGDRLRIRGLYQWTADGGVIGQTHNPLNGLEPGGWVLHGGVFYPPHDVWVGASESEQAAEE